MIATQIKAALHDIGRGNRLMHVLICLLLLTSVFFVYSSTYISEDELVRPLYLRQMLWIAVGLVFYVAFMVTDYHQLKRYQWGIFWGAVVLLILVLFVGSTAYGAKRWIMLYGGIGVQPAELAKLATIILLAGRLSEPDRDPRTPHVLLNTLLLVAVPAVLILLQPDLGTAMVFLPTSFMLLFVAGVPFRYIGGLAGLGVCFVLLLLAALFLPARFGASEGAQERIASYTGLSGYQIARIEVFFNPDLDPLGAGWNRRQSEIAVGSGGIRGKGYLQGTQNVLGYLPRSVAPTDFIFSVIAEEKGFIGATGVLVAFGLLLLTIFMTGLRTLDAHGRLLCVGIATLIFFHVFINTAMTVGLMPITGLPLPLLSYGGSFLMMVMSALGIVQSVYIRCDRRTAYR